MELKRKLVSSVLIGGLAVTAMVTMSPSAAAVGGCPSGKLCLYENTNYVDLDITSTSTKACIDLTDFGEYGFSTGIGSYVNNLSVKAAVYHRDPVTNVLYHDGTISPGKFSSNSANGDWFGERGVVCTGGATP